MIVALLTLALIASGADDTKANEGLRLTRYTDTTGHATLGYGHRCLANDHRERITMDEAQLQFAADYTAAMHAAARVLSGAHVSAKNCPVRVYIVCVDLAFNLGESGLANFRKMLAAIARRDYSGAAVELLSSRYATQLPIRAARNAAILRDAARSVTTSN